MWINCEKVLILPRTRDIIHTDIHAPLQVINPYLRHLMRIPTSVLHPLDAFNNFMLLQSHPLVA